EKAVAALVGVEYAVAVSSGTATLHLALLSLGVGPGDEVVVPAFSYVATANVVELVGAKPVFVDIHPDNFNIDPERIQAAITPRTKVLMPVHEFGYPSDMERIQEIADPHGLPIVEDAACALGSEWKGRKVGAWGKIGSFSLHPRKAVTSGEGGVLTTNDSNLAKFFGIMRNHGIDNTSGAMDFVAAGFNYRMTDIQASLVVGQVERLEAIIAKRLIIAERYDKKLEPRFFLKPKPPLNGRTTWQSYHIVLNDDVEQSRFLHFLTEKGIGANYGAQCIPVQTYYRKKYGYGGEDFPEAYRAFSQGVVLPIFDSMTEDQLSYVIKTVNNYRS
ncbi:MAG: DegT/DnrJ/EryC1/StrS family aminotransferase, partial [Syntrophales bacterium LBB04]|nr:DegT/DnrJ/EryC1/StrS family aminotransferase [Syntrophales bacterium LBB04]